MSDQHTADIAGFMGDPVIRTPNLDKLAEEGTVFDAAYTSCPLCAPSRTSFLTGQYPSKMDVYGNETPFPSDQVTFTHTLASQGYDTTLCGRMHFIGEDQRHGFANRLVGDICHPFWGNTHDVREDIGNFGPAFAAKRCLDIIGKGDSPVLAYDRDVVKAAEDYLNKDYENPQFMVVGTYAPHFPYVGSPDLVDYYKEKMDDPKANLSTMNYDLNAIKHKFDKTSMENIKELRAAYYAMIETIDKQVGQVRHSWESYLKRNNRQGIFIYLSDHGDQIGERDLYGKQTFFEHSVKIPVVMQGVNIPEGKRIKDLVSIMDFGPTLCEFTGAELPPDQDGISLVETIQGQKSLSNRVVCSEFMEKDYKGELMPSKMVRKGNWKLISYQGYEEEDLLFNLEEDPHELTNVARVFPGILEELREALHASWDTEKMISGAKKKEKHIALLKKWGSKVNLRSEDAWKSPESVKDAPKEAIKRTNDYYLL
ncbi:sulfatase-like hydrolase/transferase [Radiobacillus sp. PE A8.2]|uniref:sulfatase-like hydrolase/transferase n=1 Tax=Radiobacillus sp. PE A8.2 TaxID=3380349 RepID=UPI00388F6BEB